MVWVVMGWVVGGFMGWVHILTHLPMNSYNIKIFNYGHPPTHPSNISSVTVLLYIYFGGLMKWVVVRWFEGSWGGWLEGSWVGWCVVVGWVVGEFMGG